MFDTALPLLHLAILLPVVAFAVVELAGLRDARATAKVANQTSQS